MLMHKNDNKSQYEIQVRRLKHYIDGDVNKKLSLLIDWNLFTNFKWTEGVRYLRHFHQSKNLFFQLNLFFQKFFSFSSQYNQQHLWQIEMWRVELVRIWAEFDLIILIFNPKQNFIIIIQQTAIVNKAVKQMKQKTEFYKFKQ